MATSCMLTERILGCAHKVASTLGNGFLERVYENALAYELQKVGHNVQQQCRLEVRYDGHLVGEFFADLLVDGEVLVELKATPNPTDEFAAQCLNHLRATGLHTCLLMNFGQAKLDIRLFERPLTHFGGGLPLR